MKNIFNVLSKIIMLDLNILGCLDDNHVIQVNHTGFK
jgi:hypothetical protein